MKAIIGLGNPGVEYRYTRHNIGFLIIDRLIDPNELRSSDNYFATSNRIDGNDILYVKPTTYMNLSGNAIRVLLAKYPSLNIEDILVIYDDCHLPLGKIRYRTSGSDAGHNGIKDITEKLGTKEFPRLRFGINEPKEDLIEHVLGEFTIEEEALLTESIDLTVDSINDWINHDTKFCMNKYNGMDLR